MRTAAEEAVTYLLNRLQSDGDLMYLIGPFTESFELLCQAEADITGRDVEVVKASRADASRCSPRRFFSRAEHEAMTERPVAIAKPRGEPDE